MGNSNKRIDRNRTKALRVKMEDWMIVDKVAGSDRAMKEGFHEIIEEYLDYKDMDKIEIPESVTNE